MLLFGVLAPSNGAMGFGVPAAVAGSLAYPGRQVVSIAGDGCFLSGGYGERVATTADLAPALDRALGAGRPAVLHLDVDPARLEPLP